MRDSSKEQVKALLVVKIVGFIIISASRYYGDGGTSTRRLCRTTPAHLLTRRPGFCTSACDTNIFTLRIDFEHSLPHTLLAPFPPLAFSVNTGAMGGTSAMEPPSVSCSCTHF